MANCKGMNNIKLQSQQRQKAPLVMKLINSLSMGMEIEIMPFFYQYTGTCIGKVKFLYMFQF